MSCPVPKTVGDEKDLPTCKPAKPAAPHSESIAELDDSYRRRNGLGEYRRRNGLGEYRRRNGLASTF